MRHHAFDSSATDAKSGPDGDVVTLSESDQKLLENGVAIMRLLHRLHLVDVSGSSRPSTAEARRLLEQESELDREKFQARLESTPLARTYNWNTISKILPRFGIDLDYDMKMLIVAGDTDVIVATLEDLYSKVSVRKSYKHRNNDSRKDDNTEFAEGKQHRSRTRDNICVRAPEEAEIKSREQPTASFGSDERALEYADEKIPPSSTEAKVPLKRANIPERSGATEHFGVPTPELSVEAKGSPANPNAGGTGSDASWLLTAAAAGDVNYQPSLSRLVRFLCESMQNHWPKRCVPLWEALLASSGNSPTVTETLLNGVDGSFHSVLAWLQSFDDALLSRTTLIQLLKNDAENLLFVLTFLTPGLRSRQEPVAEATCNIIDKIIVAASTVLHWPSTDAMSTWLTPASGAASVDLSAEDFHSNALPATGLSSLLRCLHRHSSQLNTVVAIVSKIVQPGQWGQFFKVSMKQLLHNDWSYLRFSLQLLPPLCLVGSTTALLIREGVVDCLFDDAMLLANTERDEDRSLAWDVLSELCILFPSHLDGREDAAKRVLEVLRAGCHEGSRALQVVSLTCLFRMLDTLGARHHKLAPICFKTIVYALIENHGDQFVREYITSNLCVTLRCNEDVPVHVVIDPLVKRHSSNGYSNVDFDFFLVLARYPQLPLKHAMLLLHLLGKVCLNDTAFGRLASIPFIAIAGRYVRDGKFCSLLHSANYAYYFSVGFVLIRCGNNLHQIPCKIIWRSTSKLHFLCL